MKKIKLFFLVFVVLVLFFILLSVIIISAKIAPVKNKIDKEVLNKIDKTSGKVKVIVKLNEKDDLKIGVNDGKYKSKGDKTKYKNYIYKEVDLKELNELKENISVNEILPSYEIHAFLQEAVGIVNSDTGNALQVSNINLTGTGQTICIIDTGIDFTHPDLIGKNKSCIIDCFNKVCIENCSLGDDNGHGTHVAGIAGARGGINGIATNISLIGIKVLDSSGSGSGNSLDLSRAIDWCVKENVSVISMSLGTTSLYSNDCSDSMGSWTDSIDAAFAKNISVIASTGNSANHTAIASPACIANATPVGDTYDANLGSVAWSACTDSSTAVDQIVCHANRNSLVQLLAPGAQINSTKTGGGYIEYGGTSMAAPVVAGAFALINHLLNLTAQTRTPAQIESILNSTGKTISDSASGLSFSRIKIYSAMLTLDNIAPNVSLISPANNHLNLTKNQTFSCNATDWQLSNITFNLWNSTSLFYNETKSISVTFDSVFFNVTNLEYNNYKWNCKAYDSLGNFYRTSNFTLTIGGIQTNLISPDNSAYRNINLNNFTCQSLSGVYELKNVSFYLWNSTRLIYNQTKLISGFDNSSVFNYSFSYENNYKWNCLSVNNVSNFSWATNYTFVYDITNPSINLTSPDDSSSYSSNSQAIIFSYNVSDNFDIANCSLIIDNIISLTNSTINKSLSQEFSQSFSPATYNWIINCTDNAGNKINSSQRSFTVTAPVVTSSSGGGGGGSSIATGKIYIPTNPEIARGYTKELGKSDKIEFTFFDYQNEEHSLTLNSLGIDFVEIIIQSSLIKLKLGIGQSAKLNLSSSSYYDIYIKLNSIENNKASLTIQTIHEEVPKSSSLSGEAVKEEDKKIFVHENETINQQSEGILYELNKLRNVVYFLVLIIIVIVIFFLIRKKQSIKEVIKKDVINKYKEKFEKEVKPRKNKKK